MRVIPLSLSRGSRYLPACICWLLLGAWTSPASCLLPGLQHVRHRPKDQPTGIQRLRMPPGYGYPSTSIWILSLMVCRSNRYRGSSFDIHSLNLAMGVGGFLRRVSTYCGALSHNKSRSTAKIGFGTSDPSVLSSAASNLMANAKWSRVEGVKTSFRSPIHRSDCTGAGGF
jgi:hypothetical protein